MKYTSVLLLTNSQDATSDYIESRILSSNIKLVRYNTDSDLIDTEVIWMTDHQILRWGKNSIHPSEIGAVILRRPKPLEPMIDGDENQKDHTAKEWTEVLEGFLAHIPFHLWINHPSCNFMASHKIHQLSRAVEIGLTIPRSLATNNPIEGNIFIEENCNDVIVKPLFAGYIQREKSTQDTHIYTNTICNIDKAYIQRIVGCPVLFQEKINKKLDIRLTYLDGMMEAIGIAKKNNDGEQILDIRRNNMVGVEYSKVSIPEVICKKVARLMRSYNLRFAALDFALNKEDVWVFFEINPNGQWAWLDLEAEAQISNMFINSISRTLRNQ